MKRFIGVSLAVLALGIVWAGPALAAEPDGNASYVAQCATRMGGQHVADCAQAGDQGISTCAGM